jgi:hypothetical protein
MMFPLGLWDVSLLTAITAIILLITLNMLSPYHGKVNILINRKRLKHTAMAFSLIFLATVALRIINIILY